MDQIIPTNTVENICFKWSHEFPEHIIHYLSRHFPSLQCMHLFHWNRDEETDNQMENNVMGLEKLMLFPKLTCVILEQCGISHINAIKIYKYELQTKT